MGKPITQGIEEIEKCAWVCRHYSEFGPEYLSSKTIPTEHRKSYVCYRPLGVIFSIMPWNFPFWQVLRFAVPAIMAGNTVILKHAPNTTGSGQEIERLFLEAGFPEHVFQQAIVSNPTIKYMMAQDKMVGITLTGSEHTGRIVAARAVKN